MPENFSQAKIFDILEDENKYADFVDRLSKMSTKELGKLHQELNKFIFAIIQAYQSPKIIAMDKRLKELLEEVRNLSIERNSN